MSKKSKQKAKASSTRDNRKQKTTSANGTKEIARAEKRLEKTLARLDEVRSELANREATLRGLLVKHGRMPAQEEPLSTEPLFDQQQAIHPLDGLSDERDVSETSVSVPLLDQQQVLDVGSREPVQHES